MPGITISSAYGAGGEQVAPLVAEQLGFQLLDRAISAKIAADLDVSVNEAEEGERKRTFADRFFAALAPMADTVVGNQDFAISDPTEFRREAEKIMNEALTDGAVILGRAGASALHDNKEIFKIRLYGDPDERVACAVRYMGVDEETARRQMPAVDRARAKYTHHLYGRDIDDPRLYDLQVNTPALELNECADMIVAAYRAIVAARGKRTADTVTADS
ncbi:AAA family ATPase [Rudaeicoccus suwonensis]|uniref:Cytidylate kinase n=1 Tax=Rudaeicoccus suwonensis TaxID=657409 RepID=A0A561DX18_9MICO|nr:cytidylate kinase-like family protein [Rudaeicoccus suwonensis]TWE07903.1 cytidylate kinase [Rudaeicoccus suwonensis]